MNTYGNHREIYISRHGPIPYGWDLHHINGKKGDNRDSNHIILPKWFHGWIHDIQYRDYQRAWNARKKYEKHTPYKKFIFSKRKIKKKLAEYLRNPDQRSWPILTERARKIAKFGD